MLNIQQINDSLKLTGKAIVGIGDSFVEGQGAIDDELYENYTWRHQGPGYPLQIVATDVVKRDIVRRYPDLILQDDQVVVKRMTFNNSFVSVLANKYFMGAYTPINFGKSGGANRGRVKQIYLHPQINWDLAKEIIVIFMPTSIERFDFIEDTNFNPAEFFKTVWPSVPTGQDHTAMGRLWSAYAESVYTEKAGMLESILAAKELETWCQLHNAHLVVTPAFDTRFKRENMDFLLNRVVKRFEDWSFLEESPGRDGSSDSYIDLWPWASMFDPEGQFSMVHMCMSHEPNLVDKEDYYFQFQDQRSPLGWITPCSHPGQKGHDLFARLVFEHIQKTK